MIVDKRMTEYIASLDTDLPPKLALLESKALTDGVPIIRKDSESLLRFLLELKKPIRILEIGTAVGFSALLMAEYMPEEAHITTIEKVEMRLVEARVNLAPEIQAGRVTLLEGDAASVLKSLREEGRTFDFVFMDAAKAQYNVFLDEVLPMLEKDGLLVTDNVLQEGSLIDSKFLIERRDRTIHMRMRDYLYRIKHDPQLTTSICCVGDGMALSIKK